MCGILGQINFKISTKIDNGTFKDALNLQSHRGPDDSDIYLGQNFAFGHRRLSIIDLHSHAKQPMISTCENYLIVFNGEIYNYQEIKEELLQKGHKFNTESDTEVLLSAYIEFGIECIQKFIGMFSFAIYDKKKDEFYVVRDRLGVKPLYFYFDEECFIFSSEIKSILKANKQIKRKLNYNAVSSYLSFRYPILEDTFFDGIHSLEPAHYLKISKGKIDKTEYWSVVDKFKEQAEDKGEEYYIKGIQELLESSVKYRMISDVPFGSFLSGGVDSSVITALMAKNSDEKIRTFTIGFEEEGFNEFNYSKVIADKFDTNHQEIVLSGTDYISTMEKLISYKDAPLSVPNEVPLYLMTKELKKYITVVLSGEGADEIFGGYGRIFRSPYDYERLKDIDSLDISDSEKEEFCQKIIKKYGVDYFENEIDHFINIYSYIDFQYKQELLSSSVNIKHIEEKLTSRFLSYFNELTDESYYNKVMYVFEKIHIVGLLQRVDMTTMANSVEARVPFIDHRLVEFAATIPLKYKLKWKSQESINTSKTLTSDEISEVHDTPKYILKKSFENLIPDSVLYRKKMGFPVPLHKWFGGDFNDYAKKILLSSQAKKRNIYNIKNVESGLMSNRLKKDHKFAMNIWMLINLELFLIRYFDEKCFSEN